MPVEPEANELLSRSPLALVIAMLLDQQVTLEEGLRRSAGPGPAAGARAHRDRAGRVRPGPAGRDLLRTACLAPLPEGDGRPDAGPGPADRRPVRRRRRPALGNRRVRR